MTFLLDKTSFFCYNILVSFQSQFPQSPPVPEHHMDSFLSRIAVIANNTELSSDAKIEQIKAILAEATAATSIITRLVATPKSEGGYDWVNPSITDVNFQTTAEPSLEGARLDKIVGSRTAVLAELNRLGRRAATVAELLLYGIKNPEEQRKYWIYALAQVWSFPGGREFVAVLDVDDGGRRDAILYDASRDVYAYDRVLSFPQ